MSQNNAVGHPFPLNLADTSAVGGNLPIANLDGGTGASGSTFWRGDGTWAVESGSGTVNPGSTNELAFYASPGDTVSGLATLPNSVLATDGGGAPHLTDELPPQVQVPIDSLAFGTGASSSTFYRGDGVWAPASIGFVVISGTSQAALVNTGYINIHAGTTTIYLPAACNPGDIVRVVGGNVGNWLFQAFAGQTIIVGIASSSSGGTVSSASPSDALELVCIAANTTWSYASGQSLGYSYS